MIAAEDFSFAMTQDELPQIRLPEPGFVYAPVSVGQKAGIASVYLQDRCIGRIPLIYGQTIEQEQPQLSLWQRLLGRRNL